MGVSGGESLRVTRHNTPPFIVGQSWSMELYLHQWLLKIQKDCFSDCLKIKTYKPVYLYDSFSAATVFLTFQYMLQCHLTMRERGSGCRAQTDLGWKTDPSIHSQCVAVDSTLSLAEPVTLLLKMGENA